MIPLTLFLLCKVHVVLSSTLTSLVRVCFVFSLSYSVYFFMIVDHNGLLERFYFTFSFSVYCFYTFFIFCVFTCLFFIYLYLFTLRPITYYSSFSTFLIYSNFFRESFPFSNLLTSL